MPLDFSPNRVLKMLRAALDFSSDGEDDGDANNLEAILSGGRTPQQLQQQQQLYRQQQQRHRARKQQQQHHFQDQVDYESSER